MRTEISVVCTVTVAFSLLIRPKPNPHKRSSLSLPLILLTLPTTLLRSELLLPLLALIIHHILTSGRASFLPALRRVILSGMVGGFGGLVVGLGVDGWMWGPRGGGAKVEWWRWLRWPELEAVVFNVVEGKSAEWGVSLVSPTHPNPLNTLFPAFS